MFDLEPATTVLARLVRGVPDRLLDAPTPCRDTTVGALLEHIDGFCTAFTAAARKEPADGGDGPAPSAGPARPGPDRRARIPDRLAELAQAWRAEPAWHGTTRVAGMDVPGEVAAAIALDEVIVHGWDIAVATGQDAAYDPGLLERAHAFVRSVVDRNPEGRPGLFDAPVPVPDDAPPIDRLIGLTGRDPGWRPAA